MTDTERHRCPYAGCGFEDTDDQVNEHRATAAHNDQPQAGSNVRVSGSTRR